MSRLASWSPLLLLAFLLGPIAPATAGTDVAGPMVGHVTPTSALIWMYAGARAEILIRYRRDGDGADRVQSVWMPPYTTGQGTCRVRLEGLAPNTKYHFVAIVDGRFEERWRGHFTTAPAAGRPARFRGGVTSCMDRDHGDFAAIATLRKQEPALCLLLGDNVYADTTNRGQLWAAHLRMRGVWELGELIRKVPTLAVWDDHDFATNDSDGTAPGKEGSLLAFQELFPNPSFGTPEVPGVFFRFTWGDVEFFMLDVRYHRSPNDAGDGPHKHMLGEGQMRWLVDGLKASKARFKVLASGSTLKENPEDGWHSYGHARAHLFRAIREHRVEGVLFLTGDVHYSAIRVHPASETGFYDLLEVISSGIAVGGPNNFATLDFDTTAADPTVHVRIVEKDGKVSKERTQALSAMRVGTR